MPRIRIAGLSTTRCNTSGGLVGKISKVVDDREIQVEIAEGVRVRVVRSMIAEVRTRGEPIADAPKNA